MRAAYRAIQVFLLLSGVLVLPTITAAAADPPSAARDALPRLLADRWVEVTTAHFSILTDAPEGVAALAGLGMSFLALGTMPEVGYRALAMAVAALPGRRDVADAFSMARGLRERAAEEGAHGAGASGSRDEDRIRELDATMDN